MMMVDGIEADRAAHGTTGLHGSPVVVPVEVVSWYPSIPSRSQAALVAAGFVVSAADGGVQASRTCEVVCDGTVTDFEEQAFTLTGVGDVCEAAGVPFDTDVAWYEVVDTSGRFEPVEFGF